MSQQNENHMYKARLQENSTNGKNKVDVPKNEKKKQIQGRLEHWHKF